MPATASMATRLHQSMTGMLIMYTVTLTSAVMPEGKSESAKGAQMSGRDTGVLPCRHSICGSCGQCWAGQWACQGVQRTRCRALPPPARGGRRGWLPASGGQIRGLRLHAIKSYIITLLQHTLKRCQRLQKGNCMGGKTKRYGFRELRPCESSELTQRAIQVLWSVSSGIPCGVQLPQPVGLVQEP